MKLPFKKKSNLAVKCEEGFGYTFQLEFNSKVLDLEGIEEILKSIPVSYDVSENNTGDDVCIHEVYVEGTLDSLLVFKKFLDILEKVKNVPLLDTKLWISRN